MQCNIILLPITLHNILPPAVIRCTLTNLATLHEKKQVKTIARLEKCMFTANVNHRNIYGIMGDYNYTAGLHEQPVNI